MPFCIMRKSSRSFCNAALSTRMPSCICASASHRSSTDSVGSDCTGLSPNDRACGHSHPVPSMTTTSITKSAPTSNQRSKLERNTIQRAHTHSQYQPIDHETDPVCFSNDQHHTRTEHVPRQCIQRVGQSLCQQLIVSRNALHQFTLQHTHMRERAHASTHAHRAACCEQF
jgi:hypothetical protein